MLKLVGYGSALSAAPGDTVAFKVSAEGVAAFDAEIVRLIHGDANPAGPGFKAETVTALGRFPGRFQPIAAGSAVTVPDGPALALGGSFTAAAMIWPTLPGAGRQAILAKGGPDSGWWLGLDEAGSLAFGFRAEGGSPFLLATGRPLLSRQWYLVAASFDHARGAVRLVQRPLRRYPLTRDEAEATLATDLRPAPAALPLTMAAWSASSGERGGQFDGKIDSPRLVAASLAPEQLDRLFGGPLPADLAAAVIGAWDFALETPTERVVDTGPHGLHGRTVNFPARGMKGFAWTGAFRDWMAAPGHYGAIHFHRDDLYDAGWATDFAWTVPEGCRSAVYAAHVVSVDGAHEDYIPFAVRPPRGRASAAVAVLLPTSSYMAYANDHCSTDPADTEMLLGRLTVLQPGDLHIDRHREYGLSLYDTHADGSGVCYSSRLRPILNLRPKYASWLGGAGSGLWQFNADTHLIDWLEAQGIAYDVVTDEDLHAEGAALLAPYRVVLTGTHPEYHSLAMWDAMRAWLDAGGRLMYLGGNGWYWRIAFHPVRPGIIEVRRAEDGTRTWEAEPGEYHHSFTGEYGGLWQRAGRPPNQICGLGFTAQGFDVSSYYRRQPGSFDPRAAFIFAGIGADERIGDFGLVGGGAAGLELDRADLRRGTPPHALVLASSQGHGDLMLLVNEEFSISTPNLGGSQNPKVHADLVFFETPAGGAVFSTGSIAWCGSLSHNGYDNNVSRIMRNVLDRFLDPSPFPG